MAIEDIFQNGLFPERTFSRKKIKTLGIFDKPYECSILPWKHLIKSSEHLTTLEHMIILWEHHNNASKTHTNTLETHNTSLETNDKTLGT